MVNENRNKIQVKFGIKQTRKNFSIHLNINWREASK